MWAVFSRLFIIFLTSASAIGMNMSAADSESDECISTTTVVVLEDFESYSDAAELQALGNWRNAQIHTKRTVGNLTKFLGRYQSPRSTEKLVARRNDPLVFYPVPFDSDFVFVSFDFYEIGGWGGEDSFRVILNGEKIDLGKYGSKIDEQYRFGSTQSGIVWTAHSKAPPKQLGFSASKDQIHHVIARVPAALYVATGDITLRFVVDIDGDRDEACGIDNIMIEAVFECEKCNPKQIFAMEDFESKSAQGWVNGRVEGEPGFSNYLGRYDKDDNNFRHDPVKAFIVPDGANKVTIEWDFYEIDNWRGSDGISAYVNGIEIPLGIFNVEINEAPRNGKAKKGITWSIFSMDAPSNIGGSPNFKDQKHRVKVTVPRNVYEKSSILLVRFAVRISDLKWIEAAGFDNVQLTAFFDCGQGDIPSNESSGSPEVQILSPASSPNFMPADNIPSANSPVFPSIMQGPISAPALSPNFTPNVAPTDTKCMDSDWTFFVSMETPKANCTWLADNSEFIDSLCNKRSRAWFYCPVTCGRFT